MPHQHPAAKQIRDLCANEQFHQLDALLAEALRLEPNHPELLTESARYQLYRGREAQAYATLDKLPDSSELTEVAQHLANYFHCRHLASKKDVDATAALRQLETRFGVHPAPEVGIKISACLIVKNEEAHLERCLKSLKDAVDEIVVIDTGSTDRTIEIANRFGAKIAHFEWIGDFSAARNVSLEHATGNWILWIDADEELVGQSARVIRNAVQRPQFGGFSIEIVNFTADGTDTSQYIHQPIRLFQNRPTVRFSGRIHEQICGPLRELALPGASLEGARILHYGYRPSEMEAKGKIARTLDLLQKEVLDHPTEPFHWFNLCNAFFVATRFAEAEHAGRQCARFLADGDPYGTLNYQLLIGALAAQNKLTRALQMSDEANARGFGGLLIDFERANVHLRANEPEEALRAIDRSMGDTEWPEGMTGDRSIHDFKRFIVRGQALAILGRSEDAIEMFDRALKVVPDHASALYSKAATLEKLGDWPNAYEGFLAARRDPSVGQLGTKGAARVTLRMGLAQESAKLFREAWEADPEDYDCWVGWTEAANAWGDTETIVTAYEAFAARHEPTVEIIVNWGRALQAIGQFERALTLFTEAMRREPENPNAYFNCGDLLYQMGHFDDAAHIYQCGLRLDSTNPNGWFVLGNSLAQLGLEDGAKLAFNQALILEPNHHGAKHNLSCLAA